MNRKQIQRRIIKLFYRLGIYIDIEFFPSVQKLYDRIMHKPAQKQVAELEKICSAVSAAQDHSYYNELLKKFIPNWDLPIKKSKFLGTGQWSGFNSFRVVQIQGQPKFEKLFDTHTQTLEKLLWIEKQVFPLLVNQIKTPSITNYYRGEVLSLAYFEFLSASPLPEGQGERPAIEISKKLYQVSLQSEVSSLQPFDTLNDFRSYNRYKMWFPKADTELQKHEINSTNLEDKIDSGRKVFTHGDLKDFNIFEDGSLIDWDEFGIYPAGLEQAFIYARNLLHYDKVGCTPLAWLEKNYKSIVPKEEWSLFKLSYAYFLFIFSFEKLKSESYKGLKKEILSLLKQAAL